MQVRSIRTTIQYNIGNDTKGQLISKAIYRVLNSPKKEPWDNFYVLKIIPTFVFWEN